MLFCFVCKLFGHILGEQKLLQRKKFNAKLTNFIFYKTVRVTTDSYKKDPNGYS